MLLREVGMVPGNELQAVMEGRPWHTFYTRVRQDGIGRTVLQLVEQDGMPLRTIVHGCW